MCELFYSPMPFNIIPMMSHYWARAISTLTPLELADKLEYLEGARALILDYCGGFAKYANLFRKLDADTYVMDDASEDASSLVSSFDVVFVLSYYQQQVKAEFAHIPIIVRKNKIML